MGSPPHFVCLGELTVREQPGSFPHWAERLGDRRSATMLAWLTYQGGGIVRKYVSLKECNLFFVCFTKCVLTRERAEDSQIPRLVLS